jgi:glycine/D-amino acid oxidase-like deaminating enzyme
MTCSTADVVICGAGMAGVAAAYHLAVKQGIRNIVLVDQGQPLTLTSSKGTEAYRNWWPGPDDTMVRFMNRSIDLLEELAHASNNYFKLNRRGYVYLTADPSSISGMQQMASNLSTYGIGPIRYHPGTVPYKPSEPEGFEDQLSGADVILDRDLIHQQFPFIADDVVAMTHARRCGWFNAGRLGEWLLQQSKAHGVRFVQERVEGVQLNGNQLRAINLQSGDQISTNTFVIAAGPYLKQVGSMLGLDIPVVNELHGKIALEDQHGIVPRDIPMLIWTDPVKLEWTAAERQTLMASDTTRPLLDTLPGGIHIRPRGTPDNPILLIVWTYDLKTQAPIWPPIFDRMYPEVLLRGLARMIPGISVYFGQGNKAYVDGGYYCKTPENRPLVGPLPIDGTYVIGALSGFGVMGAQAAAELLAIHIIGGNFPSYAPAFEFKRYYDPAYLSTMETWDATAGQL